MGWKFDRKRMEWVNVPDQDELPLSYGHHVPGALYGDPRDWRERDTTAAKPKIPLTIQIPIERNLIEYRVDFNGDVMEAEMPASKLVHFFQHDGEYAAIDLSFARLCVQATEEEWKGQYQVIKPGFKLKIPKLPGSMYAQILAFFRYYVIDKGISGVTEAMSQIYWDNEAQEYFINIPEQEVTGGAVRYNFDKQDPRTQKKGVVRVFDIHSHNTMSSFFSGIDDGDEKGRQFYGVIGNIAADSHTEKFRVGINGEYHMITVDDVVDMSTFQETGVTFPEEWKAKVSIPNHMYETLRIVPANSNGNVRFRKDHTADHPSMVDQSELGDPPFMDGGEGDFGGTREEYDQFKDDVEQLIGQIEKPRDVRTLIKLLMKSEHAQTAMESMAHIAVLRRKKYQNKRF